jgi:hypothetical protein
MLREKRKWMTRKRESTDARHRGGAVRSSDEGLVMRLERRGCIIQPGFWGQPEMGGTLEYRKPWQLFLTAMEMIGAV